MVLPRLHIGKNLPSSAGDARDGGRFHPSPGRSPGGGNGDPLQNSWQENSMDRGAWWAIVHGIAELDETEHTHIEMVLFPFIFIEKIILKFCSFVLYVIL